MKKNRFCHRNPDVNSGFTMIELLVTASIIALLSTIGVTGFQAITKSGRDAVRKSDLEALRSSLEIYKSENKQYPVSGACVVIAPNFQPNYIAKYPTPPKAPDYSYCYERLDPNVLTYRICARMENDPPSACTDCNSCNGGTGICGSNNGACNYIVKNP